MAEQDGNRFLSDNTTDRRVDPLKKRGCGRSGCSLNFYEHLEHPSTETHLISTPEGRAFLHANVLFSRPKRRRLPPVHLDPNYQK